LAELGAHARAFAEFLKAHRGHLELTGLPPRYFRPCPWLYLHLGRLYDTRVTSSPYPLDELFTRSHTLPNAPPYQWVRTPRHQGIQGRDFDTGCKYEDADLLPGMDPHDASRVERDRPRVFEVKLRIVESLAEAAERADPGRLWNACLGALKEEFNADEMEFYFRLDRYYLGADARDGLDDDPDPKMTPGGLTNLLQVAGHVEAELTHGALNRAREALPTSLLDSLNQCDEPYGWRYLTVFNHPNRRYFDAAVDELLARWTAVEAFWREYRDRLRKALREEFRVLVPVEMMPRHAGVLRGVVQDYANAIQAKRERGEHVIPPQGRSVFRKDGNSWTIQFGDRMIAKPHSDGLFYIAQLLRHPGRVLSATALRGITRGLEG
jgi:hypothetical protein